MLFYHEPGHWALERLAELRVPLRKVRLPRRTPLHVPARLHRLNLAVAELSVLWRTRRLARALVADMEPAAVVVVQDTLLLERFLVREANRRGRGTLVVQWAFTFPQEMYDRLREVRRTADVRRAARAAGRSPQVRRWLYDVAQHLLGVNFGLANSYGGGEAQTFAVMGEVFKQQFLAQGVRKQRIEVTGHPIHDLAFARRAHVSTERMANLRDRYGLPREARIILYATQPVLWRGVVTPAELTQNVTALGRAVSALGPDFRLVLKLHPRETTEDYADALKDGLPIQVVQDAEILDLIEVCEAFISSSSSTVLMAMMLDKPVVTVNFNSVPHFDYYETVGGTLHVRSPDGAQEALRLAVFDGPSRMRLATERDTILASYTRFDGGATRRLADLILELRAA
jgi:hypothetical protein